GLGVHLPHDVRIDLGFGYLFNKELTIENNESTNMNSTDFTNIVYNPYAGLDYEQETEIYIASFAMTMPLEVQLEMLHHQLEMGKHALHSVGKLINKLNPFAESEKEEETSADDH
ncbi:MAG: hypothetical protein K9K82_11190, partial [Desulfobacteraceae bacterium]|nr:hypothetical protein [Desulfobacteraceae bacterium]